MDSKELPGELRVFGEKYTKVLNPLNTEAPELSYLFDFIDIDESGQVNLEELLSQSIWKFAGFLSNTVFATVVFPCKEILFLETDSEASDVFWWYFNDV